MMNRCADVLRNVSEMTVMRFTSVPSVVNVQRARKHGYNDRFARQV